MRDSNTDDPLSERFRDRGLLELDDSGTRARLLARMLGEPALPRVGSFLILRKLAPRLLTHAYLVHDPRRRTTGELVFLPALAGPALEQLQRTIATYNLAAGPSMPSILAQGRYEGRPWIVTEHRATSSMREWLHRPERGWADVVEQMLQLGRALVRLHAYRLVHGEVGAHSFAMEGNERALLVDTIPAIAQRLCDHIPREEEGTVALDQADFCVAMQGALLALESQREIEPPSWLLAISSRGMAPRPEHRWPSMQDLLRHLEHQFRMRPRLLVLRGGAAA